MDSFRAVVSRSPKDVFDIEIALAGGRRPDMRSFICHADMERCAVRIGIHGDARDASLPKGTNDPDGDLAAIGNQDFAEAHALTIFTKRKPIHCLRNEPVRVRKRNHCAQISKRSHFSRNDTSTPFRLYHAHRLIFGGGERKYWKCGEIYM